MNSNIKKIALIILLIFLRRILEIYLVNNKENITNDYDFLKIWKNDKGKIEIFSLDALVNMATSAGMRVGLIIRPVTSVKVRTAAKAAKQSLAQSTKRRISA